MRFLWLLALGLLASAAPADAQTALPRSQLQSNINAAIKTGGNISGPILNTQLNSFLASVPTLLDPNTFSQPQTAPTFIGPVTGHASLDLPLSGLGTGVQTLLGGAAAGTGGPVGSVSPTLTGQPIISDTITVSASDVLTGILYVHKTTNFGTAGGASSGIFSSIYGQTDVGQGTWSNQVGVYGIVNNSNTQHSQPGSTASAVGVTGIGNCLVAGCSAVWGAVSASYDTSGQASPPFPLIGHEIDNYAHGLGGGNRVGLQIVAGTPDGAGTLNTVDHGLLFVGSGAASTGAYVNLIDGGTSKAQNVISIASMTITGLAWSAPGSAIDGIGNGTFRTVNSATFTVATLPSCAANVGNRAFVSDASTAPSYNNAVPVGGGSNSGWVGCRNSTWVWD